MLAGFFSPAVGSCQPRSGERRGRGWRQRGRRLLLLLEEKRGGVVGGGTVKRLLSSWPRRGRALGKAGRRPRRVGEDDEED